jgi:hypothetical protein
MFGSGQEDTAMNLDIIVHELVGVVVEIDDVVILLEHMFPDLSEAEITLCVVRDVEQRDGAIAWIGHA